MVWDLVGRLERLAGEQPLMLCVDDLQWSDAGTLDMVHYCLARLIDLPIGWVLAARPASATDVMAHRLDRSERMTRIALGPLRANEVRRLAESLVGEDRVSDELARALLRRTGGNPFLCEELLRALPATDDEISASATEAVPAAVSQAVRERAGRLRPDTHAALDWPAVLAPPFTFEELEAVGGEAAGSAPELLAKDGFLVSDGAGGWSFVHSIVREAVYLAMSERERVRRHGAVADVLATGQLERHAPPLAAARRYVDAAAAYLELAHRALDRGQGEDAVRLFDLSAELAEEAGDVAVSLDAVAGRVLALLRCGAVDQARSEADGLRRELRDIRRRRKAARLSQPVCKRTERGNTRRRWCAGGARRSQAAHEGRRPIVARGGARSSGTRSSPGWRVCRGDTRRGTGGRPRYSER